MDPVDERVDERDPVVVHPLDPERAHDCPLDPDARVRVDVALDVVGDVGGEGAARGDLAGVHRDESHEAVMPHAGPQRETVRSLVLDPGHDRRPQYARLDT